MNHTWNTGDVKSEMWITFNSAFLTVAKITPLGKVNRCRKKPALSFNDKTSTFILVLAWIKSTRYNHLLLHYFAKISFPCDLPFELFGMFTALIESPRDSVCLKSMNTRRWGWIQTDNARSTTITSPAAQFAVCTICETSVLMKEVTVTETDPIQEFDIECEPLWNSGGFPICDNW